jgi:hypothetical protein
MKLHPIPNYGLFEDFEITDIVHHLHYHIQIPWNGNTLKILDVARYLQH